MDGKSSAQGWGYSASSQVCRRKLTVKDRESI